MFSLKGEKARNRTALTYKHDLLTKGVQVSFQNDKGQLEKKRLKIFNFDQPTENHFLAVRQFEVVGELYNRRPDVVGFVNGIPLVFFELKAHHTDLENAYRDNLEDYKSTIPSLFHCNAFIILSNGTDARVGTVTSPYKFFLEWKRIEEDDEGVVSLDTMLRGTCDKARLMDLFENFLLFDGEGADVVKIMAKNHQFIGVNRVISKAKNIEELKGKLGVFWHTQGSGKSYSMVFMCQKIHRRFGGSYIRMDDVDGIILQQIQNQIPKGWSSKSLQEKRDFIRKRIEKVVIRDDKIDISLKTEHGLETQSIPVKLHQYGHKKLVLDSEGRDIIPRKSNKDSALIKALVRAHKWEKALDENSQKSLSAIAKFEDLEFMYVTRIYRLYFLAPKIKESILDGTQPRTLTLSRLMHGIPLCWQEQARLYGF